MVVVFRLSRSKLGSPGSFHQTKFGHHSTIPSLETAHSEGKLEMMATLGSAPFHRTPAVSSQSG